MLDVRVVREGRETTMCARYRATTVAGREERRGEERCWCVCTRHQRVRKSVMERERGREREEGGREGGNIERERFVSGAGSAANDTRDWINVRHEPQNPPLLPPVGLQSDGGSSK